MSDHEIDYELLVQAINETLRSDGLRRLAMNPTKIIPISEAVVIVGGYGDVQKATFAGSNHTIAVKRLRPQGDFYSRVRTIAALVRELKVWADLRHNNVLLLQGFHIDSPSLECAWIITLWHERGNISDYIIRTQPDEAARLKLALDTARGLAYLHSRSPPVCHGDIKPENTLVDTKGTALICDFGLARRIEKGRSGLTTTGSAKYTVRYASPELLMNDNDSHTLKSDIWAWACLLLHIVTGLQPYSNCASHMSAAVAIVQSKPPAELSSISSPRFVITVLERCWRVAADSRPPMLWCAEVLRHRTTALFGVYCAGRLNKIPTDYKILRDQWHAIQNPEVSTRMEVEFTPVGQCGRAVFDPQGHTIATVEEASVVFYGVEGRISVLKTGRRGENNITKMCISHDGGFLATSHINGKLRIWNLPNQVMKCDLVGPNGPPGRIPHLAFANSDDLLFESWNRDLRTWDLTTQSLVNVVQLGDFIACIAMSPRDPCLAIACGRKMVVQGESTLEVPEAIRALAFIPDAGGQLVTGREDGEGLRTWDVSSALQPVQSTSKSRRTSSEVSTNLGGPQSRITSLAISSDGRLAASASRHNNDLVLWDLTTGLPTLKIFLDSLPGVDDLTFRPGSTMTEGCLALTNIAESVLEDSAQFSDRMLQLVGYKIQQ